MLLTGRAELFGVRQDESGCHFIAVRSGLASIAGEPDPEAVELALATADEVISPTGYVLDAPGWLGESATLYLQRNRIRPRPSREASASVIAIETLGPAVPAELREELLEASAQSPIAATLLAGEPISFCYAVASESLWDVSIDTLEPFRGRGFAALAVDLMIDVMEREGKQPVWGALESNAASHRVAAKLGFEPVDEIIVYQRDPATLNRCE